MFFRDVLVLDNSRTRRATEQGRLPSPTLETPPRQCAHEGSRREGLGRKHVTRRMSGRRLLTR